MKIAVLGTGTVGQTHASKLDRLGHEVIIGTRDVKQSLARTEPDRMTEAFGTWAKKNKNIKVASFKEAVDHCELAIVALNGQGAMEILQPLQSYLKGIVLIDITNPLDFSKGSPPSLFTGTADSLGERIQKALPETKVVKAFNTTNASVQVDPSALVDGDHHLFIAGNDTGAKKQVTKIAKDWYGWKSVIDLGDIKSARGMEMVLPIWVNLFSVLGTPNFNFKIVK